jgi:hypothetical protein
MYWICTRSGIPVSWMQDMNNKYECGEKSFFTIEHSKVETNILLRFRNNKITNVISVHSEKSWVTR